MPNFSKRGIKEKPFVSGAIVVGLIICAVTKGVAIFPLFAGFVLFGLVRSLVERTSRYMKDHRAIALFDEEELEREDEAAFGG
jgi:hypothetical protein